VDIFVVAHALGWYGKSLIVRDYWLCWILSVTFELLEYSLAHHLNNFAECWWDHVSLGRTTPQTLLIPPLSPIVDLGRITLQLGRHLFWYENLSILGSQGKKKKSRRPWHMTVLDIALWFVRSTLGLVCDKSNLYVGKPNEPYNNSHQRTGLALNGRQLLVQRTTLALSDSCWW
jgi:hypothetical protein